MNGVTIRPESQADHAAVAAVHRAAFGKDDEVQIVERTRALPEHLPELSLVADLGGRVVGHVLLSRARLAGGAVLALGPIGVLPDFQRRGIGDALMREGIERARAGGERLIILLGHPAYYPRFGFVRASTLGIRPPYNVPDEAFMALELHPGAAQGGGAFIYSAAFVPPVD